MAHFITRALAFSQASLAQLISQNPTCLDNGSALTPTLAGSKVADTFPDGVEPGHWMPDRYDPYVCSWLGSDSCWQPSEPSEGPPYSHDGNWPKRSKTCIVPAIGDPVRDDAPAILKAFAECKSDGHIIFADTMYHVRTVMNTTGLEDVSIELRGTLKWSDDIPYWLKNSIPIGFQNQTSAWHLGGERIHFYGHGKGTLDGNGKVWYDFNQGVSNRHGRPHALTITNTKHSVIEGLRFIKSQMWSMTVARSEKVLLQDIYVNNTVWDGNTLRTYSNDDGVDTVYANNITFLRWKIANGDDSISMKQNSTNIYIADCEIHNGMALAMGSIGQYPGQINVIENVTAERIKCIDTSYAGRIKTWTGTSKGVPPNGGGGGLGHAKNITFRDFELENVKLAWSIAQCTSYNGQQGGCDTSEFQISDMHWGNTSGTLRGNRVATLQCSGAAPCPGLELYNNTLFALDKQTPAATYLCDNVVSPEGFECTGDCDGDCPHE